MEALACFSSFCSIHSRREKRHSTCSSCRHANLFITNWANLYIKDRGLISIQIKFQRLAAAPWHMVIRVVMLALLLACTRLFSCSYSMTRTTWQMQVSLNLIENLPMPGQSWAALQSKTTNGMRSRKTSMFTHSAFWLPPSWLWWSVSADLWSAHTPLIKWFMAGNMAFGSHSSCSGTLAPSYTDTLGCCLSQTTLILPFTIRLQSGVNRWKISS